jgi:hypothetical protein
MERKTMNNTNQLELGFKGAAIPRRQQKINRARWWFTQMRRAVDSALDWQPSPPARPEQTWFAEGSAPESQELRPAA